jgi:hypothetical protein
LPRKIISDFDVFADGQTVELAIVEPNHHAWVSARRASDKARRVALADGCLLDDAAAEKKAREQGLWDDERQAKC